MSTTLHTPEVGTAPPVHRHLTTALWVVVGVLVAALVALGAWVIVDRYTGPEYDAAATIDDVTTAWSAGDLDAIRSLYAGDAVLVTAWGATVSGMDELVANVLTAKSLSFTVERIAPVTTEGDYATTFVRYSTGGGEKGTLVSVFQFQDGQILRHWDFEPGQTVTVRGENYTGTFRPPYPSFPSSPMAIHPSERAWGPAYWPGAAGVSGYGG